MRKALAKEKDQRKKFRATFSRMGKKINYRGYSEETILLSDIIIAGSNTVVADHVWFSFTKGFEKANLKVGDLVEFEARIKEYSKGYVNKRVGIDKRKRDYKLSNPTRIIVINP